MFNFRHGYFGVTRSNIKYRNVCNILIFLHSHIEFLVFNKKNPDAKENNAGTHTYVRFLGIFNVDRSTDLKSQSLSGEAAAVQQVRGRTKKEKHKIYHSTIGTTTIVQVLVCCLVSG